MFEGSNRRFGVTTNISGLSHGIVVNNISFSDSLDSAEARDHNGNIIDIAVYGENEQVSIDGVYVGQGVEAGTIIKVNNKSFLVTSTGRNEINTAFQTASVNARYYPGQEPPIPPVPPPPIQGNPLIFKSVNGIGGIALNAYGSPQEIDIKYYLSDQGWLDYTLGQTIVLSKDQIVAFSGANDHFSQNNNFYYFSIVGDVEASGNIMSLMNFSDSCTNYCFYNLFRECSSLLTAPQLSATTLADNCYKSTFLGCTSLTSAPQLPVTTLKTSCYSNMFNSCSALTNAPYLPAKTLAIDCYNYMFANCSNLSSINVEFTSWNVINSTNNWVQNVAASGIFTKPSGLSEEYGDSRIPTNWRAQEPVINPLTFKGLSSSNAVQLIQNGSPYTIVLDYSKNNGPWTTYNVGDIIELNENETVAFKGANDYFNSYYDKYQFVMTGTIEAGGNIQSLLNFSNNATQWCYSGLFRDCSSLIQAPQLPATGLAEGCYCYMFLNCSSLTDAPQLPATIIKYYQLCYGGMFAGCTSLTAAPQLPALEVGNNSYDSMFMNCTSLTTPPQLPATGTISYGSYRGMFANCTSLTAAPELPATGLVLESYAGMFRGCSYVSSINVSFTDWKASESATTNWVQNVASTGIFYKPAALSTEYGDSRIPTNWQVVNKDQPVENNSLTFKGLSSSNAVRLTKLGSPDAIVLDYSKNNGPWTTYNVGDTIEFNQGETVAFSGANDHFSLDTINCYRFAMTGTIKASNNIQSLMNFSDNVNSYCYYQMFYNCNSLTDAPQLPATTLANFCYSQMFRGCTSLTSAPALPATGLAQHCYYSMFAGCTSLTAAPQLSATTLAYGCYEGMFEFCINLTSAPALPATTLAAWCYDYMFRGCTSLTEAPALPATGLAEWCYDSMFRDCTSLTSAPQLPATTIINTCYKEMFRGCTSLTEAPQLSATILDLQCYLRMFYGCSNLSSINVNFTDWTQAINTTTNWVSGVAANGTFYKTSALSTEYGTNRIPVGWQVVNKDQPVPPGPTPIDPTIPLTFKAINGAAGIQLSTVIQYQNDPPDAISLVYKKNDGEWTNWNTKVIPLAQNDTVAISGNNDHFSKHRYSFYNFKMNGTLSATGNLMSLVNFDDNVQRTMQFTRLFEGCSSLITPPALPATGLALAGYQYMFQDCINLTTVPQLPATILKERCYKGMFKDCSSLVTVPSNLLPATILTGDCYAQMFYKCTSLTSTPQLPAMDLDGSCYYNMFMYCSSLITPPALPATGLADYCYYFMFAGCTSLTAAPQLPATTLANNCYERMFYGCTSLSSINVSFTNWDNNSTNNWVQNVAVNGTFYKPAALSTQFSDSKIPEGWYVVEEQVEYPEPEEPPPSEQV